MRLHWCRALLLALPAVWLVSTARASDLSDDLAARRARLMDRIGSNTMLVLMSAPPKRYSRDVGYPYRQDSNLYYLTGIEQAGTILVIMPGSTARRELLFVADRDPVHEHWEGPRLSHAEATERSGIPTVLSAARFEAFLAALFADVPFDPLDEATTARFRSALTEGTALIALALDPQTHDDALDDRRSPALELANRLKQRFVGFQLVDATPVLTDLRLVKTPLEQRLLIRSLEIASAAQLAGMRAAWPGAYEYEVKAAVEAVHTASGAMSWSFPSIVGSGPKTTILHNPTSTRRLGDGDLMLVDAAANFEYMAGDLTRTYPVNGIFTPNQRAIYGLVLRAQQAAIDRARPGATLRDLHTRAVEVLSAGLLELGLVTDAASEQYQLWFTHGTCHYLGIDVHDVGSLDRPLEPGMAFVIEPGLYIRQAALDGLPSTEENRALIERIQPAVARYLDIGVRIEDAFLLEPSGLRHLTAAVPRTIEEIETFLRRR